MNGTGHDVKALFSYPPRNFLCNIRPLQFSFTNPKYDIMELETSKNCFFCILGNLGVAIL